MKIWNSGTVAYFSRKNTLPFLVSLGSEAKIKKLRKHISRSGVEKTWQGTGSLHELDNPLLFAVFGENGKLFFVKCSFLLV